MPPLLVLLLEHVAGETLKFSDLVLDLNDLVIDLLGTARHLFQVIAENGVELLDDGMCLSQIFEDLDHVKRSSKDIFLSLEIPLLDGLLLFNVFLGSEVFFAPFLEHIDTLPYDVERNLWWFHLENLGDVDLLFDLVANLIRNAGQDFLELALLGVNVSRNGPNEFESGQK